MTCEYVIGILIRMMQPFVVRLPEEDKQQLHREALNKGVSIGEVVRHAVQSYFKSNTSKKDPTKIMLKWATRKSKTTKKNPVNSTNYKEYLYGKHRLR